MYYKDDKFIVYKHTSPSGKSYIGITHQKPSLRWRSKGQGYRGSSVFYKAIEKYGWKNIKHEILREDLSYDEACTCEQEMIKKYNTLVPNGYNVDEGGYAGTCFKKPVIGFDCNKRCFLFSSIEEAADYIRKDRSCISKVIGKSVTAGEMFFIYA